MDTIPESFLQFVWKYKLFNEDSLFSELGRVEVLETGYQNMDSGPDFLNARIRINGTVWAGNIEVHVKASDWFRHGHQDDPSYSNVILHVVQIRDCLLERPGGELIPSVELSFNPNLLARFNELLNNNNNKIPCKGELDKINTLQLIGWTGRLMIERLEEKTALVQKLLAENKYNWEETLYLMLGKGFGFVINSFPFEVLAKTSPLMILLKYRKRPLTINAILFGQAGFLEDIISGDEYYEALKREYRSIRLYLPPRILADHTWKFKGSRPASFPLIRIAQFASLVTNKYPLFSRLLDNFDLVSWQNILKPETEKYWENHHLFGRSVKKQNPGMGTESINLLILNVLIPVFFHYADYKNRNDLKNVLLNILEQIPAEKNRIVEKWNSSGLKLKSALESQAFIQLNTRYCAKRRCLECAIGQRIIIENQKNAKLS